MWLPQAAFYLNLKQKTMTFSSQATKALGLVITIMNLESMKFYKYLFDTLAGLGFVAGILGSLFGGYECELLGRRTCLLIENALVFSSMLLMSFSPSFTYLMIGRTVHGYSFGSLLGAVPIYVSEICQSQVRSKVGGAGMCAN